MSIDARTVKELRDRTGVGMMDCKKALTETDGDLDRAVGLLREKGLASASKKASRVAAEGLVGVFVTDDMTRAALVELNCETDFVAKTDEFHTLLSQVGTAILASESLGQGGSEEAAGIEAAADGGPLPGVLTEAIGSMGENISLRRFTCIQAQGGVVGGYVHAGGKIGVLVEVEGAGTQDKELIRSLAMQIAAVVPRYVDRSQVDGDEVERERAIYASQAKASGKPDNVVERIVDGKLEKYYREVCLLDQEYIRDSDLTVSKLIEQSATNGTSLKVRGFSRYQLGEGIERKTVNLAEEVAEQLARS